MFENVPPRIQVNCIDCGTEYWINPDRLGRARCDVECDDGNECGGRLMEWKNPDAPRDAAKE